MGRGGTLPLQLEDNHTRIVTCGQQILRAMGGKDPESVALTTEGLYTDTLGHVPNADAAILGVGNDKVMLGVEQTARNIVGVTTEGVDLPRLGLGHSPKLDLTIVGGTGQKGQGGVEGGPVHSTVVALEDVLDHNVVSAEKLGLNVEGGLLSAGRAGHAVGVHHGTAGHTGVHAGTTAHLLLAKAGGVPNANGLIQRGRND